MRSLRDVLNDLKDDERLRHLTDDEMMQLRRTLLNAFDDICRVCEKHKLTIMLLGGSVIGAVRHKGFIPWDDDLDTAMTRSDYEKFKSVFARELSDKYILSAPNYSEKVNNRFPQILIKNTKCIDIMGNPDSDTDNIKIDLFILENVPKDRLRRYAKGLWCSMLMYIAGRVEHYQTDSRLFREFMCKSKDGKKYYRRMMFVGRCFSFLDKQKWYNLVDSACRYKRETGFMGIPTGRTHYFGEILESSVFIPVSRGEFEGRKVKLPGNVHAYLTNLYGEDYMTIPPEEKREQHFIYDIQFDTKKKEC